MVQISFLIYLRDPIPAPHRFLSFIHHIHFEIRVLSVSHTMGLSWNLTHCCLVTLNATQIGFNIGAGDGFLPDGTKPLPEPMSTYHQLGPVAFIWGHYQKIWRYLTLKRDRKLHFWDLHFPRANELTGELPSVLGEYFGEMTESWRHLSTVYMYENGGWDKGVFGLRIFAPPQLSWWRSLGKNPCVSALWLYVAVKGRFT